MDFEIIIAYIDEHIQEDISLVELGKLAGYSPWHMYKLFKFYTGEPLASYIRKRRLRIAAREIKDEKKLLDVALNNGYETAAGFYKAFFRQFNCSPSEYKRNMEISHIVNTSADVTEIIYKNGVIEMGKVIVRKLQDGDAVSLNENVFVQNTLEEVEDRVTKSLEAMKKGHNIYVVAVVDNNIVGTLGLSKEKHPIVLHRATLGDEVVNPAFDGMGIPNLLFKKVTEFAKELGITIITGSSRANFFTERFFNENNFVEIGRIPGGFVESWNNNKTYDEILYYHTI